MFNNTRKGQELAIDRLYQVCAIGFLALLAYHHALLVSHELPLDYNEGGMLVITGTISDGGNPFAIESQPARTSVYPVLYNLLVAPATIVFGNNLPLHRTIAALFIVASCVICFLLCRNRLVSRIDSAVAASLFYAALLYYSTPIASPNGLGLFLFLSAIAIPYLCGFSKRTLAATIGCGVLAYFTKQYFLASLGYVAVYVFLAVSKKHAILFSLSALGILFVSLLLVGYTSPYFLDNTFFSLRSSARVFADYSHVFSQFTAYIGIYYPLFAILLIAGVSQLRVNKRIEGTGHDSWSDWCRFNFSAINKPFLTIKPDYMLVCMMCSIVIIGFSLGANPGNHLTYLLQLITPFLLVCAFGVFLEVPRWRQVFQILLILMMYNSYAMLDTDLSVNGKNWKKIRRYIAAADDIYASTLVLPEIVRKSGPIYADGHTRYFPAGAIKPAFFVKTEPLETVPALWERHVRLIEKKILNQEYDLILMDHWMQMPKSIIGSDADPGTALQTHYRKIEEVGLPLAGRPGGGNYRINVYKPILELQQDND